MATKSLPIGALITRTPGVYGGRPCLAGTRFPVLELATQFNAGHSRATDEEQLAFATANERTVFTANRRDFAQLHAEWMAAGRPHHGIVTRSRQQLAVGRQLLGLRRICGSLKPMEAVNLFEYLEPG